MPGINPSLHAVVYMSHLQPTLLESETGMTRPPLAVEAANPDVKLDEMSRIYFGTFRTIGHGSVVRDLGKITAEHIPRLNQYWEDTRSYL
jgi:hypothetical protein